MVRMRQGPASTIIAALLLLAGTVPAGAADAPVPVGCAEVPSHCGVVSRLKANGCPVQWQVQPIVASAAACAVVMRNDSSFGDYAVCSKLYRSGDQFADLSFTRQFGGEVLSKGSCPLPSSYPSCSPVRAIAQGSFCRCPAGSATGLAGCYPNGSGTVCMSSSIAATQCH